MKKRLLYLFPILLLLITLPATAQDITLNLSEIHEFKIDGDSNVRTWDADVTQANGTLELSGIENLTLDALTPETFNSLNITIPVSGIKSDSGRLTNNLQGYLKGDDFPEITFNLTDVTSIERDGEKAVITANGVVNAAGVDNQITMQVEATLNSSNGITFSGNQALLMTSFNIDPPTAVMGTIRSRDEMEILFQVSFSK